MFWTRRKDQQALKIAAWIDEELEDGFAWVAIINESNFPVTKLILSTVNIQGKVSSGRETNSMYRSFLSVVPPGKCYFHLRVNNSMGFRSGVEAAFIDVNGLCWVRDGQGRVKKIRQQPEEYYSLALPVSWEMPLQSKI